MYAPQMSLLLEAEYYIGNKCNPDAPPLKFQGTYKNVRYTINADLRDEENKKKKKTKQIQQKAEG